MHGLPPTPDEIDAFVRDTSPKAYEKLVDRLLASPRYGERWARHWLDVVHYGDTHGYDKDKPRPNAWPYRDYVIRAFNDDKPYARFVQEQIAGDVLYPGRSATASWPPVSSPPGRGISSASRSCAKARRTRRSRASSTATTWWPTRSSTFISLTVHCARCHDHKFDPIPQEDYYSLQAVFAGVDRADRPYDDDPAVHSQRQQLVRKKLGVQSRLQPLLDKVEFATSPEIVDLDSAIQDAGLQIAHIGVPKTPRMRN